ncbi:hypothetical protein HYFRA_00012035 [Hymenoscyphus fraxineus]|uniref:Uncharacterized protein n=1 Tax=Hymenoscyphus fraxineus TaxID=746836 RepID=A0A9N9L0M8_9HELO|nr:hypothetical protein HYFRA_00012035 [Hymenoscyphus fraxineus]
MLYRIKPLDLIQGIKALTLKGGLCNSALLITPRPVNVRVLLVMSPSQSSNGIPISKDQQQTKIALSNSTMCRYTQRYSCRCAHYSKPVLTGLCDKHKSNSMCCPPEECIHEPQKDVTGKCEFCLGMGYKIILKVGTGNASALEV